MKEEGLKKFLQSGDYLDSVCTTVGDLKEKNAKCAGCKWFKYCAGGCRLLGLIFTGDVYGADNTKCIFFEKGYMEKLQEAMPGYRNASPISGYMASGT